MDDSVCDWVLGFYYNNDHTFKKDTLKEKRDRHATPRWPLSSELDLLHLFIEACQTLSIVLHCGYMRKLPLDLPAAFAKWVVLDINDGIQE